jgi:hypothetical protein
MTNRKVFHQVLAKDLQVGDMAMIEQPSNEPGSTRVYKYLVTITELSNEYGNVEIEGETEYGYEQKAFYGEDRLVPVVAQ